MPTLKAKIKQLLFDVAQFVEGASGLKLRSYQREVALRVVDSVVHGRGLTFVVIFPRQSGKNELQAQIEAYLLVLFSTLNAEMVKVSPTWKPQSLNAMRRLERVLKRNFLIQGTWAKEQGYIYRVGTARIFFLSGSPTTNIVGATASTLLECDEAQDVTIDKWDKEVNPMAASTNATRVFWGTAWTSRTLLAREKRLALEAEKRDGIKRVFVLTADQVRAEVAAYGAFVDGEIEKLGREHPFVRTQYFSEEVDAEGGMFPARRRALMVGGHARLEGPREGEVYAFLLDVGGEEHSAWGEEEGASVEAGGTVAPRAGTADVRRRTSAVTGEGGGGRDSTALTIVRVDLSLLAMLHLPRYQVVGRILWTGTGHMALLGQITALAEVWQPRKVIVDATGVGAGLASFLAGAFNPKGAGGKGGRVEPFVFTQASKSNLGWGFLAVVETGRFQDHSLEGGGVEQREFWRQVEHCQMEILPGAGKVMRWGVPDGTREASNGELVHDDLVVSAAMCALLDEEVWGEGRSVVLGAVDVMEGMRATDGDNGLDNGLGQRILRTD